MCRLWQNVQKAEGYKSSLTCSRQVGHRQDRDVPYLRVHAVSLTFATNFTFSPAPLQSRHLYSQQHTTLPVLHTTCDFGLTVTITTLFLLFFLLPFLLAAIVVTITAEQVTAKPGFH